MFIEVKEEAEWIERDSMSIETCGARVLSETQPHFSNKNIPFLFISSNLTEK